MFFPTPVISRIESIGGEWAGGGGGWEAEGRLKQPFRLKEQCCTFSLWHKLLQCTKEAKTGESSSLVPHAVPLMHPRAIVHECAYHVQAKHGFQFLCINGRFSKIQSHII